MKLIVLSMLLFFPVLEIAAQQRPENCFTHHNAPPVDSYRYWPPGTNIKVFFERGMFTPEQRAALIAAMKIWSDGAAHTGITFTYTGEVERLPTCEGCLTVARREVHKTNRKAYAYFNPLWMDYNWLLMSARIDLDFATTKPEALQAIMAHELGHGMGLLDCMTCIKKKSIMNAFPGINKHNGLIGPSTCDLEAVRQVYERQRQAKTNTETKKESEK